MIRALTICLVLFASQAFAQFGSSGFGGAHERKDAAPSHPALWGGTFGTPGDPGLFPNPEITPGEVDPSCSLKDICPHINGKWKQRHVSESTKRAICQLYHAKNCPGPEFEIDHWIPRELCGSDKGGIGGNLWPQRRSPSLGFHEKDLTENALNKAVCRRDDPMPLSEAQRQIHNWPVIYEKLKQGIEP